MEPTTTKEPIMTVRVRYIRVGAAANGCTIRTAVAGQCDKPGVAVVINGTTYFECEEHRA
jgi:hypothetical protein